MDEQQIVNYPKEVFISVDIETSGPIPSTYSLLSLGAVVIGEPELNFYAEIKPINKNMLPNAMSINGFDLVMLSMYGESPIKAFQRFQVWVMQAVGDTGKPVFVGFNAGFDWSFVNWYFHTYIGENPFGFSPLDIKAYYMGLSGCTWSETTSSKFPSQFQPSIIKDIHNALADARSQGETFEKLLSSR